MKTMKKWLTMALTVALVLGLAACGGNAGSSESSKESSAASSKAESSSEAKSETKSEKATGAKGEINVVSREAGSGTRGAFIEIAGIEVKEGDQKVDKTYEAAVVQQGTDAVITYVSGDDRGIGYISLGSLNDTVKALKVEGVAPSEETVKDGSYKIARPFNICYKEDSLSDVAKDFIDFIFSKKGQEIVLANNVVPVDSAAPEYANTEKLSGKITIQGSTSVDPVMEAIIEAYNEVQPDVKIEKTANGSGAGITAATEGNADIGMASRELKDEEKAALGYKAIAMDGIAVVVNKNNANEDLTLEQIRQIFTGEVRNWEDL